MNAVQVFKQAADAANLNDNSFMGCCNFIFHYANLQHQELHPEFDMKGPNSEYAKDLKFMFSRVFRYSKLREEVEGNDFIPFLYWWDMGSSANLSRAIALDLMAILCEEMNPVIFYAGGKNEPSRD